MSIRITRPLAKIGKTRISFTKLIGGKNGGAKNPSGGGGGKGGCGCFAFIAILIVLILLMRACVSDDTPAEDVGTDTTAPIAETTSVPDRSASTTDRSDSTTDRSASTTDRSDSTTDRSASVPDRSAPPETEAEKKTPLNKIMYLTQKTRIYDSPEKKTFLTVEEGTAVTALSVNPDTKWTSISYDGKFYVVEWKYLTARKPEKPKETEAPAPKITVTDYTRTVVAGGNASLTISAEAGAEYSISVYYSSGASSAKGLEKKTADKNGKVTWEWKVGPGTNEGTYRITVRKVGDAKSEVTVKFNVTN